MVAGVLPVRSWAQTPDSDLKISLGGYLLTRYDSALSLSSASAGVGVSIDPDSALGLENEQSVFRLDGYYQFNSAHALTFSWYRINSDGSKILTEDVNWADEEGNEIVIPVGTAVASELTYDTYKFGYRWAFYNSEEVKLFLGAGLHMTRITLDLDADMTSSGNQTESIATRLPLPVLSVGVNYQVSPRWHWYLSSEIFAISIDDELDGSFIDNSAGAEYRLSDHWGLGLGVGSNSLRLVDERDDYRFAYDNRISGLQIYVSGYF
jgi:hypothetical protein